MTPPSPVGPACTDCTGVTERALLVPAHLHLPMLVDCEGGRAALDCFDTYKSRRQLEIHLPLSRPPLCSSSALQWRGT